MRARARVYNKFIRRERNDLLMDVSASGRRSLRWHQQLRLLRQCARQRVSLVCSVTACGHREKRTHIAYDTARLSGVACITLFALDLAGE